MTTTHDGYLQSKLTLTIKGTFDIAIARNRLRQMANQYHLPTVLQARASAAISTIANLVLFHGSKHNAVLQLTIIHLDDDGKQGLELQFFAPFTNDILKNYTVAEWQLERACDEIGIRQQGSVDYIVMRLWSRRKLGKKGE